MRKSVRFLLSIMLLCTIGSVNTYAGGDFPLAVTPAPSGRGHTEVGVVVPDQNSSTRSPMENISLQAGSFFSAGESTLEELVEEEARSQNKSYSITVAVDQPNPGTYDCAVYGGGKIPNMAMVNIGHSFVLLGNHVPDTTVYYARGLYPAATLTNDQILNHISVNGIIHSDAGHSYTIRKTYWVDIDTFNNAVIYLNQANEKISNGTLKYNLLTYNCTTFVKCLVEAAGITDTGIANHNWQIPQYIKDNFKYLSKEIEKLEKNSGCYPGAAGEQLRESMSK